MVNNNKSKPSVGLARFHKLTIGAGLLCMMYMIWRYWHLYQFSGENHHLAYASVTTMLFMAMTAYLWRFNNKTL